MDQDNVAAKKDISEILKKKSILADRFIILKHLSEGGTAKVKLGYDLETEQKVAIKILNNTNKACRELLMTEIQAMMAVEHPNLLKCIDYGASAVKNPAGKEKQVLYMALELAQKETLFDFVVEMPGLPFPESIAVQYFEQFVLGLNAMHLKGICHRDIKCENIFLDDNYQLKIADFGFAAPIAGKDYKNSPLKGALKTKLGTNGQMAPELISLDTDKPDKLQGYFGQHVDVFNAGIVLFNMIFQQQPFVDAVPTDPFYKFVMLEQANNFWNAHKTNGVNIDSISPTCKNLVFSMLNRQPDLRPSLVEILSHKWMTETLKMPVEQIPEYFAQRSQYKKDQEQKQKEQLAAKKAFQSQAVINQASIKSHRGVDENGAALNLEMIPFDQSMPFQIECNIDKNVAFDQLQLILKNIPLEFKESKSKFKLKFEKREDSAGIYVCIYLMESQSPDSYYMVFQKLEGDQNMFVKMYSEVKQLFLN